LALLPPTIRIAIDVMGGDFGPRPCVLGAYKFLQKCPSVELTLIGDLQQIKSSLPFPHSQIHVISADNPVAMSDRPSVALRHKLQSSMSLAVQQVATGQSSACVSAGNTGALMAFGLHWLGALPGIARPAICKAIPTTKGQSWILDLGANLVCDANNLAEFALMGAALARSHGIALPKVALLNVGSEEQKGRALEQEATRLLEKLDGVDFVGFVEGNRIYDGVADVLVCDGFAGNVTLKVSEGIARFLRSSLQENFSKTWWRRLLGLCVKSLLQSWYAQFEPAKFDGASFLGLNGVVVKSHGSASATSFCAALGVAHEHVDHSMIAAISRQISCG
jgi:phosphate acyltransferase